MKKIIIANLKMNPLYEEEAREISKQVDRVSKKLKNVKTIICPPFIYLSSLKKYIRYSEIGAQNLFYENPLYGGSYTGEISAEMLKNIGVKYVIIGHSERRYPLLGEGETDEVINKKIKIALSAGLKVIFCIGERARDKENRYLGFIKNQLEKGLKGISLKYFNSSDKIIFAYEPVWAIGPLAKEADTPLSTFRVSIFIRRMLVHILGRDLAKKVFILYGGSVNKKNAESFLKEGGVNGLLVGRASLNIRDFEKILKLADSIKEEK